MSDNATQLEKKVNSIEAALDGFRAANRRSHEETEMHLTLMSKMREELDIERRKVQHLQQQVEQINAFVNKTASHAPY